MKHRVVQGILMAVVLCGLAATWVYAKRAPAEQPTVLKQAGTSATTGAGLNHGMGGGPGGRHDKSGGKGNKQNIRGGGHGPLSYECDYNSTLLVGRPTATSACISFLGPENGSGWIEYGTDPKRLATATDSRDISAGQPCEFELSGLKPDTLYSYRIVTAPAKAGGNGRLDGSFHTQRAPGSNFTFCVQGDSHPERLGKQFDPELYRLTLSTAAADKPDFFICMGDDFSVDTLPEITQSAVAQVYRNQRNFLSLVGASAALFLVNGNHEQAALCNLDGSPGSIGALVQTARNGLFPLPAPDGFYSGDEEQVPHIGLLRDYYAWTWGDALFVVIDPYWHSPIPVDADKHGEKQRRDLWQVTLGSEQYHWLEQTLLASTAKYKFVFTHHVNGTGRGGIEQAGLYEWGGYGPDGQWEFDARRPGWDLPIHQLLARGGVTVLFQGHDHVFAHQELDGVVYQTLPSPADPNYALSFVDAYKSGDVLPSSGYLRVRVGAQSVNIEYVRTWLSQHATPEHPTGEVAFAYKINR